MRRKRYEVEGDPVHGDLYELNGLPLVYKDCVEPVRKNGFYFIGENEEWKVAGLRGSVSDVMLALEHEGSPTPADYLTAINSLDKGYVDDSSEGLPELVLDEELEREVDRILEKIVWSVDGETLKTLSSDF